MENLQGSESKIRNRGMFQKQLLNNPELNFSERKIRQVVIILLDIIVECLANEKVLRSKNFGCCFFKEVVRKRNNFPNRQSANKPDTEIRLKFKPSVNFNKEINQSDK